MTLNLRRPILVGGVTLSLGLWLLDSLQHSVTEFGGSMLLGLMGASAAVWWWRKQSPEVSMSPRLGPVSREMVEKAIAQTESAIHLLATESPDTNASHLLKEQLGQLVNELDRTEIRLTVTGGKAVGKTTLMQALQANWISQQQPSPILQETQPLFTSVATDETIHSDLILFVTAGDITDPEFQALSRWVKAGQRLVLVLNKQDQYLPTQQAQILQQLRDRMQGILAAEEIVAVAASPSLIKVRQLQQDGTTQEYTEKPSAQIQPLTDVLTQILIQESRQLVWADTIRSTTDLKEQAKTFLNQVRRERALPIIEQYQWISGAAAFANPVPALDLLATAAISTQLVIDLGAIYQQKFSLDQAKTVAGTLANQMLKLGLVELSTQTITHLLKSNAITFVAGGTVQGISAAYFTRIAGLSLIEYFQTQEIGTDATGYQLNLNQLTKTLQRVFQQNQQTALWQTFIQQVSQRFLPSSSSAPLTTPEGVINPL